MSAFWKGLVVLLLAFPVGAYVTSSLADSRAELPDRRTPVLVGDPEPAPTTTVPAPAPSAPPQDRQPERDRDDGDDGMMGTTGSDGDDGAVEVVRPEPRDVGDDVTMTTTRRATATATGHHHG